MDEWSLLATVTAIVLVLIGVAVVLVVGRRRKQEQVQPDYLAWFVFGLFWIVIGVALMISVEVMVGFMLVPMGVLWIVVGALHRDKLKSS
jgi:hypothetical protein